MSERAAIRSRAVLATAVAAVLLVLTYQVFTPLPGGWSIQDVGHLNLSEPVDSIGAIVGDTKLVVLAAAAIVYFLAFIVLATLACVVFTWHSGFIDLVAGCGYFVIAAAALLMTIGSGLSATDGRWGGSLAASWAAMLAGWATLAVAGYARSLMEEVK